MEVEGAPRELWGRGGSGEPMGGRGSEGKGCGLRDLLGLLGSVVLSGGLLRTLGNLQ